MVAKRKLDFSRVSDMPLKKRLRRVERQVKLNRPEMKHQTVSVSGTITAGTLNVLALTNIAQGDTIAQRSGDRIRVWRIEIRGINDPAVDNYLIQQHTTTLPTAADFTSTVGAFTLDSLTNTKFTEWKHFGCNLALPVTDAGRFKTSLRFRNGIIVKYGGTGTQPVDNGLVACQLNRSTNDLVAQYTVRIYFTDA